MDNKERLKAYVPEISDTLAAAIMGDCEDAFKEHCHRDDVPDAAGSLIVSMAVIRYNRIGNEGASGQSYSGASESFVDGLPDDLKRRLGNYRKLKTL